MKQLLLILILLFPLFIFAANRGGEEQILLQKKIKNGHSEHYTPADMPEVYYDSDNQQIILVADGIASYYGVRIVSQSTMQIDAENENCHR